jgi:hypothetical protein
MGFPTKNDLFLRFSASASSLEFVSTEDVKLPANAEEVALASLSSATVEAKRVTVNGTNNRFFIGSLSVCTMAWFVRALCRTCTWT